MIILNKLLKQITNYKIAGDTNLEKEIRGIEHDTRLIEQSKANLFVCLEGKNVNGHTYIDEVIVLGAQVIVVEKLPDNINLNVTYIIVPNSRVALAELATSFYDHPSKKIKLVGVTGTNGKTTTATILYNIFKKLHIKTGLISTIQNYIHKNKLPAQFTTPDILMINKLLNEMVKEGCEYCFMEVSSHAINQDRILGLDFAGGIFLNITQDHLDYHHTFDNYIKTKKKFFDNLSKESFALYNCDDPNGTIMVQNCKAKKYSFSIKNKSDFNAIILSNTFEFMELKIKNRNVFTKLIGNFNAYNLIAGFATGILLGLELESLLLEISKVEAPKGRFNHISNDKGIHLIVDYAHTPDALQKVLSAICQVKERESSIITVVGCGGNRDKEKRPLMGRIASKLSNKTIFTSDNPRNENPSDIIDDMMRGVGEMEQNNVITILNRREAIKTACLLAQKNDIVLIAGKGHEEYQEFNSTKSYFSDIEIAKELCNSI